MIVQGYVCNDCEEFFEEPGGPMYECGQCGTRQVDERRCESCNRFMAKQEEASCPECEECGEFTDAEWWKGVDGKFYESEEAEQEWIAAAPERERKKKEHDAWMEEWVREREARNRKENAVALPLLKRAYALTKSAGESGILANLKRAIEEMERYPENHAGATVVVWIKELAPIVLRTRAHEDLTKPYSLDERGWPEARDYERRQKLSEELVEKVAAVIPEAREWFRTGAMGGLNVNAVEFAKALVAGLT